MLASSKIEAFVATAKPDQARHFYETVLGLKLISDSDHALIFDVNATTLLVSKVDEVVPAPYTVLGWQVTSIRKVVQALGSRDVVFERYPYFEQDDVGIWTAPNGAKVAWFKDPDGNLLSVSEMA